MAIMFSITFWNLFASLCPPSASRSCSCASSCPTRSSRFASLSYRRNFISRCAVRWAWFWIMFLFKFPVNSWPFRWVPDRTSCLLPSFGKPFCFALATSHRLYSVSASVSTLLLTVDASQPFLYNSCFSIPSPWSAFRFMRRLMFLPSNTSVGQTVEPMDTVILCKLGIYRLIESVLWRHWEKFSYCLRQTASHSIGPIGIMLPITDKKSRDWFIVNSNSRWDFFDPFVFFTVYCACSSASLGVTALCMEGERPYSLGGNWNLVSFWYESTVLVAKGWIN